MLRIWNKTSLGTEILVSGWMRLGLNYGGYYGGNPSKNFRKTFHTPEWKTSSTQNIPSDCWSEYSGVKGRWERRKQTGGGRHQKKNRDVEVKLCREKGKQSSVKHSIGGGVAPITWWRLPSRFWCLLWVGWSLCRHQWWWSLWWLFHWKMHMLSCLPPHHCLSCWKRRCLMPPMELFLPHTRSTHMLQRERG